MGAAVHIKSGKRNEVATYYGIMGIPSNLLIDPSGKIVAGICGARPCMPGWLRYCSNYKIEMIGLSSIRVTNSKDYTR